MGFLMQLQSQKKGTYYITTLKFKNRTRELDFFLFDIMQIRYLYAFFSY